MSMRDYGYDDYGIHLSDDDLLYFVKKLILEDSPDASAEIDFDERVITVDYGDEEDVFEWYDCLDYAENFVQQCGNFTGDLRRIYDDGYTNDDFENDTVVYIPLLKYPSFFEKAYDSFDDMIEKHKAEYAKYLPDDFDWKNKFVHIVGSTWG